MPAPLHFLLASLALAGAASAPTAAEHLAAGMALAEKKDFPGAIVAFDRAVAVDPSNAEAFYQRARTRADAGDEDCALDDFNRALTLAPDHAKALCARARLRLLRGQGDLALADANRALDLQAQKPVRP